MQKKTSEATLLPIQFLQIYVALRHFLITSNIDNLISHNVIPYSPPIRSLLFQKKLKLLPEIRRANRSGSCTWRTPCGCSRAASRWSSCRKDTSSACPGRFCLRRHAATRPHPLNISSSLLEVLLLPEFTSDPLCHFAGQSFVRWLHAVSAIHSSFSITPANVSPSRTSLLAAFIASDLINGESLLGDRNESKTVGSGTDSHGVRVATGNAVFERAQQRLQFGCVQRLDAGRRTHDDSLQRM